MNHKLLSSSFWVIPLTAAFDSRTLSRTIRAALFGIAILVSLRASAGDFEYRCTIKHAISAPGDKGTFATHSIIAQAWIGERFSVNRTTGEIQGGPLNTFSLQKTAVYNRKHGVFLAIQTWRSDDGEFNLDLLRIDEEASGNEKPFLAVEDVTQAIFVGTCN